MAGGWEDEGASGPVPHPDDRLWVHPSELRRPPVAAAPPPPAPTVADGRHRLALGTALVAGATGACAMFAAVTAFGMLDGAGTPPTTRTAAPAAFIEPESLTTRPDTTVQVELADGTRLAGLVVDDVGHVVVATAAPTGAVRIHTARQHGVPATVMGVVGTAVTVLSAPGLEGTAVATDVTEVGSGDRVTAVQTDGSAVGTGEVLAVRWGGASSCVALLASAHAVAGRLAVDADGRPAGLLVGPDADPTDEVQLMVPAPLALSAAAAVVEGGAPGCT